MSLKKVSVFTLKRGPRAVNGEPAEAPPWTASDLSWGADTAHSVFPYNRGASRYCPNSHSPLHHSLDTSPGHQHTLQETHHHKGKWCTVNALVGASSDLGIGSCILSFETLETQEKQSTSLSSKNLRNSGVSKWLPYADLVLKLPVKLSAWVTQNHYKNSEPEVASLT